MEAQLESGQKPSYEDLEIALVGAMQERNAMAGTVENMGGWLDKLVVAYMSKDANKLAETMAQLMAQQVHVMPAGSSH